MEMIWRGRIRHITRSAAFAVCLTAVSCLPTNEVIWLGFSPSDRYLACATREGQLRIIDLETRQTAQVSTEAADGGFEWAPDRDRLVFCIRHDGQWDLALTDPAGTITFLTRDPWRDFQPTWSPDASGIYYVSSRGGGYLGDYDIRYYDLANNESVPLISGPHDQTDPRVSPDGRWLAAISYQSGNPLILIYAVKSLRVIQVTPPPALRGGQLRLLVWLRDSRRLLYEVAVRNRYHLVKCEIEDETSEVLETSEQPFESVALDRQGRDLLYVTGGKAFRRKCQPHWSRAWRLGLDDLPVSRLAVRHTEDRVGAVVAGSLLATASSSGRSVQPLLGPADEYLQWGDLEMQRGRKRRGLRYYDDAVRLLQADGGEKSTATLAAVQLSRASLLCRLGHAHQALAYLHEAQQELENATDAKTRERLHTLFALTEFVWNDHEEVARAWLDPVVTEKPSNGEPSTADLLRSVLEHPDKQVRQSCRRGIQAFWSDDVVDGLKVFQQLLESRPADPVVQALYVQAATAQFALPLEGVFQPPSERERHEKTLARMVVRYPEIVGEGFEMDRNWFFILSSALLDLHDADGLKRLVLNHGLRFVSRDDLLGVYRDYWRMENQRSDDPASDEVLARVLFDPDVLAKLEQATTQSQGLGDIHLARARSALVNGEYDEMKRILAALADEIDRTGPGSTFGTDPEAPVAYVILQAELAERSGAWEKAVARYREATRAIEALAKTDDPKEKARLQSLLSETRFRSSMLQRGAAARGELIELLTVERAVGDGLMTQATDPTSLGNGIHNYFALLGRVGTPWIRDLIYLKAGQGYRHLGRWGEAAFCLRVAVQSRERFLAGRAREELAGLFAELEDPGLAAWFSPRR